MEHYWVGNQIALLRKKQGYTGEKFAELLGVSAQAVSKWENGKCLPETALLPQLAHTLGVTIDQLLVKREILITKAVVTDGVKEVDITGILNQFVISDHLNFYFTRQSLGISFDTSRMCFACIEYELSTGIYYTFAAENTYVMIDKEKKGLCACEDRPLTIVGAYFGTSDEYKDCMNKLTHYNYFEWDRICVNSETFPAAPEIDNPEYLSLIYLNIDGLHVISAEENETLIYNKQRTEISLEDKSASMLSGIKTLGFGKGMDCTWAGAMTLALNYMGNQHTYEEIMGISGACYRLAFWDVWDWSATDALVCFDYASRLFEGLGIIPVWANRLDKKDREKERQRIVSDILHDKPVLAINLRIAPEWGVITGYADEGRRLYCRTYFDGEYLNESEDYLESDFWPFLIQHFEEQQEEKPELEQLTASLQTLIDSYEAQFERGYYQGKEAYEHWIAGLMNPDLWGKEQKIEDIERRLEVNDALLLNLIDARRCAGSYLKKSIRLLPETEAALLNEIADCYIEISKSLEGLRESINQSNGTSLCYNGSIEMVGNTELLSKESLMLQDVLAQEDQIVEKAKRILVNMK